MPVLINAQTLSKRYDSKTLFRGISLTILDGERIGLIGPNGAGKSTLLKILAGLEHADEGKLETARAARIAYLAQEDEFPPGSTVEGALLEELHDSPLDERTRRTRAAILMGKLGFEDGGARADTLSGGWRKRLAIGRQLTAEPDVLLLDEPTNHLDLGGISWLERFLEKAGFAYVLISHDRLFLEKVTNRVVELNPRYPEGFFSVQGRYSDFVEKREEFLAALEKHEQSLTILVKREVEWLRRGPPARTTKAGARIDAAHQKIKSLAELRRQAAQGGNIAVDFNASHRRTNDLVIARGIAKSLGGRRLFSGLEVELSPGTRLGILGNNGSGKTTLMRVLAGQLPPDEGTVRHAPQLRVVLFDQNREQLDRAQTLRRALSPNSDTVNFRGQGIHVVSWAQRFLFRPDQLDCPVGMLSGGEQARVMIARMMQQPADLLLLDEPTNDLDIPSLEVLEKGLVEFPGAIVLITHDRHMLDRVCTVMVGLHAGAAADLYTDLSQWEAAEKRLAPAARREPPPKEPRPKAAPARARLTHAEKKELTGLEKRIPAAEAEVEKLKKVVADPAVAADYGRMHTECQRLHDAQVLVDQLYRRWHELESLR
ncbi:MAG: ABC-F family ATP-binding cassette domain-containing protein [Candidatus Brocadiia bacterium]|jgi:ATP-binding cassette subfamily F protein uup